MDIDATKEQLLDYVAPCSIVCYACAEFKRGAICHHAGALLNYFDGFTELRKGDEGIRQFTQTLAFLSNGLCICEGCRNNRTPSEFMKKCFIRECVKEHRVDFCGECGEFPCRKVLQSDIFGEKDLIKWETHNTYIQENGAAAFLNDFKNKSQYAHHKGSG